MKLWAGSVGLTSTGMNCKIPLKNKKDAWLKSETILSLSGSLMNLDAALEFFKEKQNQGSKEV